MESVFSSAILLSLDVIKFWSSLEQGKQIWAEFWAIMSKKKGTRSIQKSFLVKHQVAHYAKSAVTKEPGQN